MVGNWLFINIWTMTVSIYLSCVLQPISQVAIEEAQAVGKEKDRSQDSY